MGCIAGQEDGHHRRVNPTAPDEKSPKAPSVESELEKLLADPNALAQALAEDGEHDDDGDDVEPVEFTGEFAEEKRVAYETLFGIISGLADAEESRDRLEAADPTLVYFMFKWIRKHYHRDHPDNAAVRAYLSDITNQFRALTRKAKDGEGDPIVEWFESTYRYRELSPAELIDVVIEKLEG